MGELLTAHLAVVVQSPDGPSRFRPHDVIREHTHQVSRDLPGAESRAVLRAVVDLISVGGGSAAWLRRRAGSPQATLPGAGGFHSGSAAILVGFGLGELLSPAAELLAERGGCLGVEAVGGVLLVGVALHTAEGVGEHPSVESGVVLCGEFDQPLTAVAGLEQAVDIDGVADLGPGEQGAGLPAATS
ncbi:hypothetical protein [Streptomyces sp. NPDC051572]|uniref:hypothetical protein n=1 Tax=unclassified Streptomyces TaxID=2593676 RepID=UPI00344C7D94